MVYATQYDTPSPAVNVWSVQSGVMTPIPITFTNMNGVDDGPRTIAIDGAGVLYFTVNDWRNSMVTYDTVTGTAGTFSTIPAGYTVCPAAMGDNGPMQYLMSVAVDQWGNIFVQEDECQQVIEIKPDGSYVVTSIPGNQSIVGVDANDNIFLTGGNTSIVETVSGGTPSTIYSGVNNGYGEAIVIDAADTLYITG